MGQHPEPVRAGSIAAHCHRNGVVVLTCGTYGNVLRFLPPLAMPDHLLDEAFAASEVARGALGDEVVDHYVNMADVELAAYGAAVTDWELRRYWERV